VRAALATIAGVGTVSQQTDGSVVAAYNGTTYTLRPGYGSVTTSAEHANEFFWHDDAHLYLNYMNGTSQAFTLQ
jgi:hypothetical protein